MLSESFSDLVTVDVQAPEHVSYLMQKNKHFNS